MTQRTILIVEDSRSLALTCKLQLEGLGHMLLLAETGQQALAILNAGSIDCVLLDLNLPDMDGLDILRQVKGLPSLAVVVITANASLNVAVEAIRLGAFDFLAKPFAPARLATTVSNALSTIELKREVETLRLTVEHGVFGDFIGRSPPMQRVYRIIEAAAPSSASVFITGESGTGKELAARALHRLSPRASRQLVALNCAAIPRDLLESTIFGHVKGAFTGATTDQEGAASRAEGGTLFLDELADMPFDLQTKLLRFIQTGSFERVGEGRTRAADIRFVAATNRDPAQSVREGRLREDLFYRLHVIPLEMPPLRDRGEDILSIARRFLAEYASQEQRKFQTFSPEAEALLVSHAWPGNVRQLQGVIRNAVVLNDGPVLTAPMLSGLADPIPQAQPAGAADQPFAAASSFSTGEIKSLAVIERGYIERAIELCEGNIHLAARKLGVSASTIYRKKEAWSALV